MKSCSKCNQLKPLAQFHIDNKTKDGHRADCKECRSKKKQQYKLKQCKKCNQLKPLSEFRTHNSSKDKRRHSCKQCEPFKFTISNNTQKPKQYTKHLSNEYINYLTKLYC